MRMTKILCVCAMVMVMAAPAFAQRRRSSNLVMTPNGPVPKSMMYPSNMSPQQLAAQQKAEMSELEQYWKQRDPVKYQQYQEYKKAQAAKDAAAKKKK